MGKIAGILKKAAAKQAASPKKKSATPAAEIPELDGVIQEWIDAHKAEKDAKAKKATAEATILPRAEEERLRHSMNSGAAASSVRVNDKVLVSVQNRYKKILPELADDIKTVVGNDKFDRLFREKTSISLTDEALANEELVGKLVDAVGEDDFERWFKVEQTLQPTEVFHKGRVTDPLLRDAYRSLKEKGLVEGYKPSLKPA